MNEAASLCVKRGAQLTTLRRLVLTMLLESERPMKAYEILPRLRADGKAKPPTLYRTIDFLVETGLAHKVESLDAYVACGHWTHDHSAVFLICEGCGLVKELHAGDCLRALQQEIAGVNFKMQGAVIEVRGRCEQCR